MTKSRDEPNIQLHRVGQCDLVTMVACGFGVTIVAGRLSHAGPDGVVLVPPDDRSRIRVRYQWYLKAG